MKWIFLGEVCIPKHVVFPCSVPLKKGATVTFEESKRMGSALAASVRPAKYVTDTATIYHALYDSIPTSSGAVPVREVVERARRLEGNVCSVMKAVNPYSIAFTDEESKRVIAHHPVYPVIVVYKDWVWEHISLAPAKALEGARVKLDEEFGLGLVEVAREAEVVRPYAHTVLLNPTTLILRRACNLTEGSGRSSLLR